MNRIGVVLSILLILFLVVACGMEEKTTSSDVKKSKENVEEQSTEKKDETKVNDSKLDKNIDAGKVISANIRSGTTGKNVADLKDAQLEQLITDLTAINFEMEEYNAQTGWSYSIEFVCENSSISLFLTQNAIIDSENEKKYICATDLNKLIEKYIQ